MKLCVLLVVFCAAAHVSSGQSTHEAHMGSRYTRSGQCAYTFVLPPSSMHTCGSGHDPEEVGQLREMVQQLQTKAQQQETTVQQLQTKVQQQETKVQQQEAKAQQQEAKVQQLETTTQQQETKVLQLQAKVQVLEMKTLSDNCAEGHRLPGVPSCYHLWKLGCRQSGSYVMSSDGQGSHANVSDVFCDFKNFTLPPEEIPRTCSSLYELGMVSGEYTIDPDGPGNGVEPFTVYCDMDWHGKGVTVIGHDSEARTLVINHAHAGSYMRDVTYQASMDQLRALILVSESCKQFIKYECYNSAISSETTDYAWWVTWDGRKADYWGGAWPGSGKCACGVTATCDGGQATCNCDNNDNAWRQDEGYLVDKRDLPVTQLRFGDTWGGARGYHRLGKLMCS